MNSEFVIRLSGTEKGLRSGNARKALIHHRSCTSIQRVDHTACQELVKHWRNSSFHVDLLHVPSEYLSKLTLELELRRQLRSFAVAYQKWRFDELRICRNCRGAVHQALLSEEQCE